VKHSTLIKLLPALALIPMLATPVFAHNGDMHGMDSTATQSTSMDSMANSNRRADSSSYGTVGAPTGSAKSGTADGFTARSGARTDTPDKPAKEPDKWWEEYM
jgi:hypothetical protein